VIEAILPGTEMTGIEAMVANETSAAKGTMVSVVQIVVVSVVLLVTWVDGLQADREVAKCAMHMCRS
jgi:hypothetical protein